MGRIIVSDNVSLDGVIAGSGGRRGRSHAAAGSAAIKNRPELGRLALDEALGSEAMLMGRRTYEWFAGRWPSRTGALAERLNGLPKYVVSSTLEDPRVEQLHRLKGDLLDEVGGLKSRFGRGHPRHGQRPASCGRCWSTILSTSCG